MSVFGLVCRTIMVAGFAAFVGHIVTKCNRDRAFNDNAAIYGLGLFAGDERVSHVLDSLADGNGNRFGEVLADENARRNRFHDADLPNVYSVGYIDTLTGERFDIDYEVYVDESYDGESWTTSYNSKIIRIALHNPGGISPSAYSIHSDYLRGGKGFNRGYCATVTDTCVMLFKQ